MAVFCDGKRAFDLCCSKGRSKPREALHLGISRDYFIGRQQNDVRFVVICWDFQVVQHIEFLKALSNIVNVNAHVGHVNFFKLWEELMSHPGCLKPQRKGFSSISWWDISTPNAARGQPWSCRRLSSGGVKEMVKKDFTSKMRWRWYIYIWILYVIYMYKHMYIFLIQNIYLLFCSHFSLAWSELAKWKTHLSAARDCDIDQAKLAAAGGAHDCWQPGIVVKSSEGES